MLSLDGVTSSTSHELTSVWCLHSVQVALQLHSGAAFISSTPEQLYVRTGSAVASEAVAGTRPRGPAGVACCHHLMLLTNPPLDRAAVPGKYSICANQCAQSVGQQNSPAVAAALE